MSFKRLLSLLVILLMAVTLVGCPPFADDDDDGDPEPEPSPAEPEPAPEPEPAEPEPMPEPEPAEPEPEDGSETPDCSAGTPAVYTISDCSASIEHIPFTDGCPDVISTCTIQNEGGETFTCDFISDNNSIDVFPPSCGALLPGAQFSFETQFNCDSPTPRTEVSQVTVMMTTTTCSVSSEDTSVVSAVTVK